MIEPTARAPLIAPASTMGIRPHKELSEGDLALMKRHAEKMLGSTDWVEVARSAGLLPEAKAST